MSQPQLHFPYDREYYSLYLPQRNHGQKSIALYEVEKLIVLRVTIICDISVIEIILSCWNHRKQLQNKTGI
jgi:hypothetical protein